MSNTRNLTRGARLLLVLALSGCGSNPVAPPTPAPTPLPTPTPRPATLSDLSATVTSTEDHRTLNCRQDVHATVTLTNKAESDVTVSGIKMTTRITSGDCNAPDDYTYRPSRRLVSAGQAFVVLDQSLFTNGSGCCQKGYVCTGNTCGIEEVFVVKTNIGDVAAGTFGYRVRFEDCVTCSTTVAAAGWPPAHAPACQGR